jgi:hypothetical protein
VKRRALILVCVFAVSALSVLGCESLEEKTIVPGKRIVTVRATADMAGPGSRTGKVGFGLAVFDSTDKLRSQEYVYQPADDQGITPEVVRNIEVGPGERISVVAFVDDNGLQVYPIGEEIRYDSPEVRSGTWKVRLSIRETPTPSVSSLPSPSPSPSPSHSTTTPVTTLPQIVTKWDLSGKWILRFAVTGGNSYDHDYTIIQSGGSLSGTGGVPAGGSYDNRETFTGTNGMTTSGSITIHSVYENGTYFYDITGTIDKDGKLSGTWIDNYNPVHKGTFYSISGVAKPIT